MKIQSLISSVLITLSLFLTHSLNAAVNHTVSMYYYDPSQSSSFYSYSPSTLTVPKGDTVTWTNTDTFGPYQHTTTSGPSGEPDGLWNSGPVSNGQTFKLDTSTLDAGTYPYYCGFHGIYGMAGTLIVASSVANLPPTVSITNLVAGARFRAPANITLSAAAADSDGTVTNVQFFSGANSVGNVTSSPFDLTLNNMVAGNYSFTAKAFDNLGATTTSPAISVFVQTNAMITSSLMLTPGTFAFTLNGISGQTYTIETSSNLVNWSPLSTNIAPSSIFSITDTVSSATVQRFYRVRQDF